MKYFVKFFVVTFFLLVCSYSFAEQKIVTLDMTFVLNQSKAGKGAQDFLKKSFSNNQKKFADIEKNLKKEENDLLSKKNILTKDEYNKKADSLRKKVIDYQSQRRSSLDKIIVHAEFKSWSIELLMSSKSSTQKLVTLLYVVTGSNSKTSFCNKSALVS